MHCAFVMVVAFLQRESNTNIIIVIAMQYILGSDTGRR